MAMKASASEASSARRLVLNGVGLLGTATVRKVVTFGSLFVISRALSLDAFNHLALVLGLAELFRGALVFSSDQVLVSVLSIDRRHGHWLASSIVLKAVFACLGAAAAWLVARAMLYPAPVVAAAPLIAPYLMVAGANESLAAFFQARHAALRGTRVVSLAGLGYLALVAFLAYLRASFPAFVGAMIAYEAAILALQYAVARRLINAPLEFTAAGAAELLRKGFMVGLAGAVTLTYFRIDVLLLGRLKPDDVGAYFASYKLSEAALVAATAVSGMILPELVSQVAAGRPAIGLVRRSLTTMTAVLLFTQAAVLAAGPLIVSVAYGSRYSHIVPAVVVLLGAVVMMAVNMVLTSALLAAGRRGVFFPLTLANLAFNICANFVLIPSHGFVGAAWATLMTEALNAVMQVVLVRRSLGGLPLGRWSGFALAASVLIAALAVAGNAVPPLSLWSLALSLCVVCALVAGRQVVQVGARLHSADQPSGHHAGSVLALSQAPELDP